MKVCLTLAFLMLPGAALAQGQTLALPDVNVILAARRGIDRDKVPALVQTLTAEDFARTDCRTSPKRCSSASPA